MEISLHDLPFLHWNRKPFFVCFWFEKPSTVDCHLPSYQWGQEGIKLTCQVIKIHTYIHNLTGHTLSNPSLYENTSGFYVIGQTEVVYEALNKACDFFLSHQCIFSMMTYSVTPELWSKDLKYGWWGKSDSACLKACLMPIKVHTTPTSSIFCIAFLIQLMSHYSGGLPVVIEGTNMDSANQYQLFGGSFPFKVRLMVSFRAYSTVPIKSSDQIGPWSTASKPLHE